MLYPATMLPNHFETSLSCSTFSNLIVPSVSKLSEPVKKYVGG